MSSSSRGFYQRSWYSVRMRVLHAAAALTGCIVLGAAAAAQRTDVFVESIKHPAIAYASTPVHDAVAELDARLRDGSAKLAFEPEAGYLRSVLDALKIPVASQSLVFSQGSAQA